MCVAVCVLMSLPHGAMAVADREGVQGGSLKPPSLPTIFKYHMKMK